MEEFLWLAVTNDELELPVYVERTAKELADKLEITITTVFRAVNRNWVTRKNNVKIIKIEVGGN